MNSIIKIRLTIIVFTMILSSNLFAQDVNNVEEKNHTIMFKTQFFFQTPQLG
jgi:hypothetical protein